MGWIQLRVRRALPHKVQSKGRTVRLACLRLIRDPELAVRLGAQAHGEVTARFAPGEIARQTVDFIRRVQAS